MAVSCRTHFLPHSQLPVKDPKSSKFLKFKEFLLSSNASSYAAMQAQILPQLYMYWALLVWCRPVRAPQIFVLTSVQAKLWAKRFSFCSVPAENQAKDCQQFSSCKNSARASCSSFQHDCILYLITKTVTVRCPAIVVAYSSRMACKQVSLLAVVNRKLEGPNDRLLSSTARTARCHRVIFS